MIDFSNLIEDLTGESSPPDSTPDKSWVKALPVLPHEGLWAAIDERGFATLLIEIPTGTPNLSPESQKLKIEMASTVLPGDGRELTFLRLWVEDERFSEVFGALCNRLIAKTGILPLEKRANSIRNTLNIWRFFWTRPLSNMSASDEIGLFGELHFLNKWLSNKSESIHCWTGGGFRSTNHDFHFNTFHVEIKTTAAPPPGVSHYFHGLQQLELGNGTHPLFLFSCAIAEEESGDSLLDLVDQIFEKVYNDLTAEELFTSKLQERGFSPDRSSYKSFTVRSELLYEVRGDFPRIVANSFKNKLPPGIHDEKINYLLDMQACDSWIVTELPK
jgi:hypothetical protein